MSNPASHRCHQGVLAAWDRCGYPDIFARYVSPPIAVYEHQAEVTLSQGIDRAAAGQVCGRLQTRIHYRSRLQLHIAQIADVEVAKDDPVRVRRVVTGPSIANRFVIQRSISRLGFSRRMSGASSTSLNGAGVNPIVGWAAFHDRCRCVAQAVVRRPNRDLHCSSQSIVNAPRDLPT